MTIAVGGVLKAQTDALLLQIEVYLLGSQFVLLIIYFGSGDLPSHLMDIFTQEC